MHPMVNVAVKAAREAEKIIMRSIDKLHTIKIAEKGRHDFVTNIDQKAEEVIIATLRNAYPTHKIIGEESGESGADDEYTWIIDPLDGTTNYIHGIPHFCISIACKFKDKVEHAVIYDPMQRECFTATRGSGAQLNERKIRVSDTKKMDNALLGTGFPFRNPQHFKPYMKTFNAIFPEVSGVRRIGSAALDLAYVAAGRLDGFWEIDLNAWDMAAGVLLVREAGGHVTDFQGEANYLEAGNIVAGNTKIHKLLLSKVQENLG